MYRLQGATLPSLATLHTPVGVLNLQIEAQDPQQLPFTDEHLLLQPAQGEPRAHAWAQAVLCAQCMMHGWPVAHRKNSWSLSGCETVLCWTLYVSTITSRSFLGVSSTLEAKKRHVVATCE
jgi:hypothetical protein